jgi:hypothetical protein
MAGIRRCRESFTVWTKGSPRVVAAGDLVDAGDPVVKGREHLFEDVDAFMASRSARAEQATAAPGERREVSTPRATARGRRKSEGPSGAA